METLKNTCTLHAFLRTQDIGDKGVNKICDAVLNDTYERVKDPITDIIVNAFLNNEYGTDRDSMILDIDYAITMLQRAKAAMKSK